MKRRTIASLAALAAGVSLVAFSLPGASARDAAPTKAAKKGGTLKIDWVESDTDYIDPALAYYQLSWEVAYSTCSKLVNYQDGNGNDPRAQNLIPDAATATAKVSGDGKSYTYTVKSGLKFSYGEPLTALAYKKTMERTLAKVMSSPSYGFFNDIAGAAAYNKGTAKSISGITVSGNKITYKLNKADPTFLARNAMPFTCPLPPSLWKNRDKKGIQKTLPGSGPYFISNWAPKRSMIVKTNPNYKGKRPHNVDEIQFKVNVPAETAVLNVTKGTSDIANGRYANSAYADFKNKFANRYHVDPELRIDYIAFNTSREPFASNVDLRKAVNNAIDRTAINQLAGVDAGRIQTNMIPKGIPGYSEANSKLFPLVADVAAAKTLVGSKAPSAPLVMYSTTGPAGDARAQLYKSQFQAAGLQLDVQQFDRGDQFQKEGVKGAPYDMADEAWGADYPDPFDFINILLDGTTIQDSSNVNFAYLNDPAYNTKMADTNKIASPKARLVAYGQLEKDLSTQVVPWAVRGQANSRLFSSPRLKTWTYHPIYSLDYGVMSVG